MQSYDSPPAPAPVVRDRGILLSVLLLLSFLGNVVLVGGFLVGAAAASRLTPDPRIDPAGASAAHAVHNSLLFLSLLAAFQLAFLTGTWMWKRWGVYGYASVAAVGMALGAHVARVSVLGNLVWGFIVIMALIPKWKHFE